MKKERIVLIISLVIMSLSSIVSAMAVSAYLYNSNEVSYNNNASGITSTNVQGAIDELYGHVTDYTSMDTRVSSLENRFKNNAQSYFDGNYSSSNMEWLVIKNTNNNNRGIRILDANDKTRGLYYLDTSNDRVHVAANDSSGTYGQGTLDFRGNPVKINGINASDLIKHKCFEVPTSSLTKGMTLSSYVSVDSGYKFLAYQIGAISTGYVTNVPIYLSDVNTTKGWPYWYGDLPSDKKVTFCFFEIIS